MVTAPEGERRQLTVLFCDLVGSTPLSQQLDAEDWRDVLTQYQKAAAGPSSASGATWRRYLGDGLLVYFGWPPCARGRTQRASALGSRSSTRWGR